MNASACTVPENIVCLYVTGVEPGEYTVTFETNSYLTQGVGIGNGIDHSGDFCCTGEGENKEHCSGVTLKNKSGIWYVWLWYYTEKGEPKNTNQKYNPPPDKTIQIFYTNDAGHDGDYNDSILTLKKVP